MLPSKRSRERRSAIHSYAGAEAGATTRPCASSQGLSLSAACAFSSAPRCSDSLGAHQHNKWTLCLFAVYLQGIESDITHVAYAQSTISSYVETVATASSTAYGFKVLQQRGRFKART